MSGSRICVPGLKTFCLRAWHLHPRYPPGAQPSLSRYVELTTWARGPRKIHVCSGSARNFITSNILNRNGPFRKTHETTMMRSPTYKEFEDRLHIVDWLGWRWFYENIVNVFYLCSQSLHIYMHQLCTNNRRTGASTGAKLANKYHTEQFEPQDKCLQFPTLSTHMLDWPSKCSTPILLLSILSHGFPTYWF